MALPEHLARLVDEVEILAVMIAGLDPIDHWRIGIPGPSGLAQWLSPCTFPSYEAAARAAERISVAVRLTPEQRVAATAGAMDSAEDAEAVSLALAFGQQDDAVCRSIHDALLSMQ